MAEVPSRTSIETYLRLEASAEPDTRLEAIEDITKVGHYYGFEVWQARLIFTGFEQWVWVIPEPVMNYYLHRGRRSDEESELGNAEDVMIFHIGFLTSLREEARQYRLETFEPREARRTKGAGGGIIRVGKNNKVSALAQRLVQRFFEQGRVELEAVGAGAVNQAVKAVARARQTLETEGDSLVMIPEVVQVTQGRGRQTVVHLTIVDVDGGF